MPVLLAWLALVALVLAFRRRGLGDALVAALVWWSALLALGSEALSLAHALTPAGVGAFWAVVAAGTGVLAWRARAAAPRVRAAASVTWPERVLALGVMALLALLLLITLVMPANAQDVMTYHLPRVLHWAQGASLEPFPTHDSRQLYHPPFAELVDLHFLLLSGGDRWVGPTRVLFLAGAGCAAARIAACLAPERGPAAGLVAAAVAVSAPTTLLLVHGGKNDPVAGFFLLALALALLAAREHAGWRAAAEAGLALGLALLTKTTAFLLAPPFVALLGAALIVRQRRRAWRTLLALAALPLLLLAGHMARNLSVYRHPLLDPTRRQLLSVEQKGPASALSNALRFSSTHLGGPSESWNAALERGVRAVHGWLGLDADDPRTTVPGQPFAVGNALRLDAHSRSPMHLLLALVAVVAVVLRPALRRERARLAYAAALTGAALLLCASLRWSDTVIRLQSPLFLLAAPLVGAVLAGRRLRALAPYGLLLVAAVPWIVSSVERRVIGPWTARYLSRRELLFRSLDRPLWKPAQDAAAWIAARGYRNVGVRPEGFVHAEYPLWLTLKDDVPDLRLEHVNATGAAGTPAAWPAYRDFVPDVVLWIPARNPALRRPPEPSLRVGEREYVMRSQEERLVLYERVSD